MTRKTKKILYWTFGSILLIFIILLVGFMKAAPYSAIKPVKFSPQISYSDYGLKADKFTFTTRDSVKISGVFIKSNRDSAIGTIIMLHGIASCKESNVNFAKSFADSGFNAILLDMRAHGDSGGDYCTFGYYEREDIKEAIDFCLKKYGDIEPIGITGHSLGGALSIQALSYDKRIKAGCLSGTFARLDDIIRDYMARVTKVLRFKFISNHILSQSGEIANFRPFEVNPEKSAKLVTQPVFIFHGEIDDKISPEYGKRVFNNLASPIKEFLLIKNANHDNIFEKGGEGLIKKEIEFMKKNLHNGDLYKIEKDIAH